MLVKVTQEDIDDADVNGEYSPIELAMGRLELPDIAKRFEKAFWAGETVIPIEFEL